MNATANVIINHPTTAPRFRMVRNRMGWDVQDTSTGAYVYTGMVRFGAVQVVDHLNATAGE